MRLPYIRLLSRVRYVRRHPGQRNRWGNFWNFWAAVSSLRLSLEDLAHLKKNRRKRKPKNLQRPKPQNASDGAGKEPTCRPSDLDKRRATHPPQPPFPAPIRFSLTPALNCFLPPQLPDPKY